MERLQVGIIGFGSWGECHLEAYRALPFVEVAAVCDADPVRRRIASEQYGVPLVVERPEELLAQKGIRLVSIVTFERNHLQPTLLALQAGKHVLVEKPVTTDVEEAKRMLSAAAEAGRWIAPGHLLRFEPKYAEVRRLIEGGQLGEIASLYLKRSRQSSLYATYKRTHTVYELTVHDIDQAIWYAGSRVKQVYASGRFLSGAEAPELLWAQLLFDNGVVAMLHSNWLTPDAAGLAIHDYTEVVGAKGIVQFDTHAAGVQLLGAAGRTTTDLSVHHRQGGRVIGALKEQLSYLSQCALRDQWPDEVSFEDALHGIEVAQAIVQSAARGEVVGLA
ncbi:Predicted dehydrogenase [Paenibacillus sp. UNCCL117]|uniref:Gfo/Idh/MocA family protein n=1 Tax=unclassified Paenibacillus TaxID=185978 RepID=UPI00087F1EBB|nr:MULTISPECIES: Gfo/Idh/MocA family oxidoreductase [unclassified Paenibacillus]SDE10296.1 Predicted dehydrogenase [Paenibacillus sp. cl123]SFW59729.1 Predicted dehydrogenase [Paenibacillus sp. UNCCL117]